MKKNLNLWQFAGFSLCSLAGTLLHFVYEWTNESVLVAPFSAVNESTWEHMKLLYFPLLIFALIQSRFFKEFCNFCRVKLVGFTVGLISIPVLFYTYNGVFGKSPDWVNISIYFVATAAAFFTEWRLFRRKQHKCKGKNLASFIIFSIGILFILFTFLTPRLPIFQDPITHTYGIPK
jgi:hypothetical protein